MGRGGRGKRKSAGRGGGKGKRRRKQAWIDASDDEAGEGKSGKTGKGRGGKAKGKGKGKEHHENDAADDIADAPPPPRVSRPGFEKLLKSLGADDGEDAAGTDEEDSDDESLEGDGENAAILDTREQIEPEGQLDEEEEEERADEILDEEIDEGEDEEGGEAADAQNGALAEGDGPDFYPSFWEEPPPPISTVLRGTTNGNSGASTRQDQNGTKQFELLGLTRCEAKRRDVSVLQDFLRSNSEAGSALRRFGLAPGLRAAFEAHLSKEGLEIGSSENALFAFLHTYMDVAFPLHTHVNGRLVRAIYMLHVADHTLKASAEALGNIRKISKTKRKGGGLGENIPAIADRGFTRARVLIVCPFRSTCYELVRLLLTLCPGRKEVANKSRFEEEFAPDEDEEDDETKPVDWRYLFAGNNDDSFRLGIAVSRKQVRLYAPFSSSDILICSPVGLRKITGAEGDRKREFDFLSSIEVCILDRADVLRMQNWEHVMEVMQVVNRRPQSLRDVDISRLRSVFADGRARAFRQTVMTSAAMNLEFESVFTKASSEAYARDFARKAQVASGSLAEKLGLGLKRSRRRWKGDDEEEDEEDDVVIRSTLQARTEAAEVQNLRGLVRLAVAPEGGPMQRSSALGISRQFFLHVSAKSLEEHNSHLFEAFKNKYWQPLGSSLERLMIVVPTYAGFLRLRKYLREEGASFCSAFEYSENKPLSRARQQFCHGEKNVMLVTERFLWYRRYNMKGADYVLFYGPPETPQIYEEILGHTRTPSQCNSMCLFTKYDFLALERLVGNERARKMLASEPGKVFVFS